MANANAVERLRALALELLASVVALLTGGSDQSHAQQRLIATSPVTFYAAPAGNDADNGCLSPAAPCTLQGAFDTAQNKWDFAAQRDLRCTVQLADGSYPQLIAVGQFTGAHVCRTQGVLDPNGNCLDRTGVVVDGFDIEDGMMLQLSCLTSASTIGGRQHVVLDLYDVACSGIGSCISATMVAIVNVARDLWVSGNLNDIAYAVEGSRVIFSPGARIVVTQPVTIPYLVLSYSTSWVEFAGQNSVVNPQYLAAGSQCIPWTGGRIALNGMAIPCTNRASGKPELGNDGMIYN